MAPVWFIRWGHWGHCLLMAGADPYSVGLQIVHPPLEVGGGRVPVSFTLSGGIHRQQVDSAIPVSVTLQAGDSLSLPRLPSCLALCAAFAVDPCASIAVTDRRSGGVLLTSPIGGS